MITVFTGERSLGTVKILEHLGCIWFNYVELVSDLTQVWSR